MSTPFGTSWSNELTRRCQERGVGATTTLVLAALGNALDAGLITLPALVDLVRSCSTTDQLGDAFTMLAATVDDPLPVGYPPAPAGRFRIVGEREDGAL